MTMVMRQATIATTLSCKCPRVGRRVADGPILENGEVSPDFMQTIFVSSSATAASHCAMPRAVALFLRILWAPNLLSAIPLCRLF
jgi:hypothetical protein